MEIFQINEKKTFLKFQKTKIRTFKISGKIDKKKLNNVESLTMNKSSFKEFLWLMEFASLHFLDLIFSLLGRIYSKFTIFFCVCGGLLLYLNLTFTFARFILIFKTLHFHSHLTSLLKQFPSPRRKRDRT